MNHRVPAAPPVDLDGQVLGRAGRERVERIRARQVRPAEHDFLLLHRHRSTEHPDLGAGARRVGWAPAEPHRHPGGAREVLEHRGGPVQAVDDHVQRPIPVQVRGRHTVRDGILAGKPPLGAGIAECEVPVVAEGHVLRGQLREQRELATPLEPRERRPNALPRIRVHHVPQVARGRQDVFVPVQVNVEEQGVPRPVGCLDPCVAGDLRERPVPSVPQQRVALPLGAVVDLSDQFGQRRVGGDLGLAAWPATQHVDHQDIHVAVSIHVREIDRHRGIAGVADREARHGTKRPRAVVEPEHVRVLEVVAHVQIGRAIAVDVGELGR